MPSLAKYRSKPLKWWFLTPLYATRLTIQFFQRQPLVWKLSGRPLPSPPAIRHAILRDYSAKYGLKTFIETGTLHGDTIAALLRHMEKLISIELSHDFFVAAKRRFKNAPQVELWEGDSTDVLPQVLEKLDAPALFWLDGHYSSGVTAHGALETPIDAEMRAILSKAKHNPIFAKSVILVDDARDFGRGDYPAIDTLRTMVKQQFPQASFEVETDIIRVILEPKN